MANISGHDLSQGHLAQCQICGSKNLELVLNLGHQAPCDSLLKSDQLHEVEKTYPLRLVRCEDCSLAQIDYVVPAESLFYLEYPYRSGITKTLAKNLNNTSSTLIEKLGLKPGSFVIDIGSNDGTLLSGFQEKGMKVLGVEPTNIAKIANEAGIDTMQTFFSEKVSHEITRDYGKASVITGANVFAHISCLGELIRGIDHLLLEDGVFVTESHYLLDILDTVQYDSIYHEHLKFYSMKSVIRLFDYYGFTVFDVDRIENYGGSIRIYAARGNSRPVSNSVRSLLVEEECYGLHEGTVFKTFRERTNKAKRDLQELAIHTRANGEKLVGIGCPGRSSTLLNFCNMDPDLMPYIAEQSTSLKLGLYLPGKHIPIVDEEIIFREQPDYVLMLSWHYWKPIVTKLREKGLKSKIVIPLPELHILDF